MEIALALREERDSWAAAHAERNSRVGELQAEIDALHARALRITIMPPAELVIDDENN